MPFTLVRWSDGLTGILALADHPAWTSRKGESMMVPFRLEFDMPTLTLKNVPDFIYQRLKLSAQAHRRSKSSEAIVCLEAVLLPVRVTPAERLARARELRGTLPEGKFQLRVIDELKRQGRP